jgi:hypothetical protein
MRRDIGLPQIDLDAPRVLAHCFLFELDRTLKDRDIEFARYMDDLNVGCKTVNDARIILRDIDLTLQTRQLRLNSGKTRILGKEDARRHFRVRQNAALGRLDERFFYIRKLGESGDPRYDRARRRAEGRWIKLITTMYQRRSFDDGNGEKILKRMLTLAKNFCVDMPTDMLAQIMIQKTSLRERVFELWGVKRLSEKTLEPLLRALKDDTLVDDVALLLMAKAVVSQICVQRRSEVIRQIDGMIQLLAEKDTPSGVLAAIMLAAKYIEAGKILKVLREKRQIWETEPAVARWVGGLHPRFVGTGSWKAYKNLIDEAVQRDARAVFEFHETFAKDKRKWAKVDKMLKAKNPSEPGKIMNAKWLMILSALRSSLLNEKVKMQLIEAHQDASRDIFWRREAKRVALEKAVRRLVQPPKRVAY